MDNRLNAYRQIDVNTANRGKVVVMLFTAAITFLGKAKLHMAKKDYLNKGKFINKAQEVVDELNYSLDLEKGKEIAQNLRSIYIFLGKYLSQANIKSSPDMLDKAIHILDRLKSAFEEIVTNPQYTEAKVINKCEMTQNSIRKYV